MRSKTRPMLPPKLASSPNNTDHLCPCMVRCQALEDMFSSHGAVHPGPPVHALLGETVHATCSTGFGVPVPTPQRANPLRATTAIRQGVANPSCATPSVNARRTSVSPLTRAIVGPRPRAAAHPRPTSEVHPWRSGPEAGSHRRVGNDDRKQPPSHAHKRRTARGARCSRRKGAADLAASAGGGEPAGIDCLEVNEASTQPAKAMPDKTNRH